MNTLNTYLVVKRDVLWRRQAAITAPGHTPERLQIQRATIAEHAA
ncbi:MAG: hypothetical protein ACRYHQ_09235 [Janthinobacterium lividum]